MSFKALKIKLEEKVNSQGGKCARFSSDEVLTSSKGIADIPLGFQE
jgi:hypothetical protein